MSRVLNPPVGGSHTRTSWPAGLSRILPAGLVGSGRRAAWRRTRLRRVASAALVASAVWVAMTALLPGHTERGVPIVVVAQGLTAGHVLAREDLRVADWPVELVPQGAATDPLPLVGRGLGAGMSLGEPVTTARLRGPGMLLGMSTGLVAAHVRLADPVMAAMATAGDHVDLISSAGKLLAADVAVLSVDAGSAGDGRWSTTPESGLPGGVIVAVGREVAMRLATADPSGLADSAFSLVMRAPES